MELFGQLFESDNVGRLRPHLRSERDWKVDDFTTPSGGPFGLDRNARFPPGWVPGQRTRFTFCIYPWVGLLQSGSVEQALEVLDRCRIRRGEVVGRAGERLLVNSQPLAWDGAQLGLSPRRVESVLPPDGHIEVGDLVAMHWDNVCQRITPRQARLLKRYHDLHLSIANRSPSSLGSRIES